MTKEKDRAKKFREVERMFFKYVANLVILLRNTHSYYMNSTYEQINSGDCYNFARDLDQALRHSLQPHSELQVFWEGQSTEDYKPSVLLGKLYRRLPRNLQERTALTDHMFLKVVAGTNTRYFDAESPKGVSCPSELPFFKRVRKELQAR